MVPNHIFSSKVIVSTSLEFQNSFPLIKLITKRGINFIMIQYIKDTRYIDSIYAYRWVGIGRMSGQVWYGLVVAKIPRTNAPLFHIIQFNVRTMIVHGHLRD